MNLRDTTVQQAAVKTTPGSVASWMRFGLPIPSGLPTDNLTLQNAEGESATAVIRPFSPGRNGLAGWVTVDAILKPATEYRLVESTETMTERSSKNVLQVTDRGIRHPDLGNLSLQLAVPNGVARCVGEERHINNSLIETLSLRYALDAEPHLIAILTVHYCQHTQQTQIQTRLQNTHAMATRDGQWDFGDANALQPGLKLSVEPDGQMLTQLTVNDMHGEDESREDFSLGEQVFVLSQTGSGGKNWQSLNHVDKDNRISVTQQGFRLVQNGQTVQTGLRASPRVQVGAGQNALHIQPRYFWQNFPACLSADSKQLVLTYLKGPEELQPGESKSWSLDIASHEQLNRPFAARLLPEYLESVNAIAHIDLNTASAVDPLIAIGWTGPDSFYDKRERIDEFGWRHFGDCWADHETLYIEHPEQFPSHYNNQYDVLYGLITQQLKQPDAALQDLIHPLAAHVADIDIYNTEEDRPEYNGGLFWHTDHYLPAATCGHRTYSRHHHAVYDGHQGGGGPGGQHCYTTGLKLYAQLTGDRHYRQKVLQLTDWIRQFYNGNGSLLGRLHRFVSIDRKAGQLTNIGFVHPGYRYPLDRGTGNYIVALLDSFDLTGEQHYLQEADYVIRNTVSVDDDLNERDLLNTENSWFYTVFLQALIRYLLTKQALNQQDHLYRYALMLLNNFSLWMLEHERFYLDSPDKLEFPNDTWAAQELRKAFIFAYAAAFFPERRTDFEQASTRWENYVVERLKDSKEARTTRILALLMQNSGFSTKANAYQQDRWQPLSPAEYKPLIARQSKARRLISDTIAILRHFSFSKELHWLQSRFSVLQKRQGDPHDG